MRDEKLMRSYGYFRGEKLYHGLIKTKKGYTANLFIIHQIASKMQHERQQQLLIDGTFSITPIFSSQLLVVVGKIDDNVSLIFFTMLTF
jgi:hypothetical protein